MSYRKRILPRGFLLDNSWNVTIDVSFIEKNI